MRLEHNASFLVCPRGHDYPVVDGVPVLLLDDKEQTIGIAEASLANARQFASGHAPDDRFFTSTLGINEEEKRGVLAEAGQDNPAIDPVVKFMIGATNGMLYQNLIGKTKNYAIPELRLPRGESRRLLDIGCNWGRWSIAAARLGYRPVGIDPSLGAVLAARRVSRQLGLTADFVVGDARFLPFSDGYFDTAFAYSVIQHFSKEDARISLAEIGRVLKPGGESLIQMPNTFGARCLFHQMKRGFRSPVRFEVRYWTIPELRRAFCSAIGPTRLSVDCFFGIGLQAADLHLMPGNRRALIRTSEFLRCVSKRMPLLSYTADSIYVSSVKASNFATG
jgi:SAM-dependent methyltransferase